MKIPTRIKSITFLLSVMLLASQVMNPAGALAKPMISPHQPPPPQGPPPASAQAQGFLPISIIRGILETEGNRTIQENNDDSPHKLSWSAGARPTECGYNCVGAPYMTSTRLLDQPNQRIAQVFAHMDFDLDINNWPFSRRIRTNLTLTFACNGWRDGSGEIDVFVKVDPPFIADGGGWGEDILDFVLLPFDLSNRIDARIRESLGPGGTQPVDFSSDCRTLGVFSNVGTGNYNFDAVVWDPPQATPFPPPLEMNPLGGHVDVTFESIKRNRTLSQVDTDAGVFFDFFVNGQPLGIPQAGTYTIAPGTTLSLQNAKISLSRADLDTLQIIVRDNLGGAGWVQFDEHTGFGEGKHVLLTHRTELLPAGFPPGGGGGGLPPYPGGPNPGGPHLPAAVGGLLAPTKPTPTDVHEFEISVSIEVTRGDVVSP
jgi:hypothetical protein